MTIERRSCGNCMETACIKHNTSYVSACCRHTFRHTPKIASATFQTQDDGVVVLTIENPTHAILTALLEVL